MTVGRRPLRCLHRSGSRTHEVELSPGAAATSAARVWVAGHAGGGQRLLDGDRADSALFDILVCASELVNTSLVAGSTRITLRLTVRHGRARLSLLDDCSADLTSTAPASRAQLVALRVLESHSVDCGIATAAAGREIWAEFPDWPGPSPRADDPSDLSDDTTA